MVSQDRLLPDCVKSWSINHQVKVRNPKSTRPWQHVLEALSGYILLAVKLQIDPKLHGEAFNFGPNNRHNYSVKSLLNEIKLIWPTIAWSIREDKKKFQESNLLKLNCKKAKKKISWHSVLTFKENIRMTIEWYRAYYNVNKKVNMKKFSENQIKEFTKLILKRSKK